MDRNISSQKEYNLKLNFKKMGESASKLTESDLEMLHRISKKPKEEIPKMFKRLSLLSLSFEEF